MNFTVYQVKLALLVFIGIYVAFGLIIITIGKITESSITSAIFSNNLKLHDAILIQSIDVSLNAKWLLKTAFLPWGVVITILGFYGAITVFWERHRLIKMFAFLLLIVASMKVPVIAYFINTGTPDTVLLYAKSDMLRTFQKLNQEDKQAALARDFIQDWHACCGVDDYNDYEKFGGPKTEYPKSCCYDGQQCRSTSEVKSDGCAKKVAADYLSAYRMMTGLSLFLTLLEVFGTIASMYFPHLLLKRQIMLKGRSNT